MAQIDLTPFLPGPLSKHIIETFYKCAPDVSRNNPLAVKVLAAQIINLCLGVYITDYPKPKPASLYIVLVGDPKTGKGTLIKIASAFYAGVSVLAERLGKRGIKIVRGATAEGLRDQLATAILRRKTREWKELGPQGRVIHIWERATPPNKSEFYETMAEILEGAWDSTDLSKFRVTDGLTIRVDADSYYFSLLWDSHQERWRSVLANLGGDYGTARRILTIYMKGELPDFNDEEDNDDIIGELAIRIRDFARMIEPLFGTSILVKLPSLSPLNRLMDELQVDKSQRMMIADYTKRLTASWIVDVLYPLIVKTVGVPDEVIQVIEGWQRSLSRSLSLSDFECITNLTSITSNNLNNFDERLITCSMCGYTSNITSITSNNRLAGLVLDVAKTWIHLIRQASCGEVIEDERVAHYKAKMQEVFAERARRGQPLYMTKKEFWHKVFSGIAKPKFDPLYNTLIELGYIIVRKYYHAEYVFHPKARHCGTCMLWGTETCPNTDLKTGIRPDPRDEPCELYRPVGEA